MNLTFIQSNSVMPDLISLPRTPMREHPVIGLDSSRTRSGIRRNDSFEVFIKTAAENFVRKDGDE